jgi:hypothetical protein
VFLDEVEEGEVLGDGFLRRGRQWKEYKELFRFLIDATSLGAPTMASAARYPNRLSFLTWSPKTRGLIGINTFSPGDGRSERRLARWMDSADE